MKPEKPSRWVYSNAIAGPTIICAPLAFVLAITHPNWGLAWILIAILWLAMFNGLVRELTKYAILEHIDREAAKQ